MLTSPPHVADTPPGPCSILVDRMALAPLLHAIGAMIDVAATATGRDPVALAEWVAAALVQWAERDRAAMWRAA